MSAHDENTPAAERNGNGLDEREVRQEAGRAARKAQDAKIQAYKLRQAAYGAADAEERQKLLEESIDKEIEAESFGKTAKYMRTGTFQGMAVGAGIGVVPGVTLGTLTGTLVGGVTSLITGGLGAGVGALTGALHGPFWNLGQVMGRGVRKVTGDLPGWAATEEQKKTLETMIGHIKDQDMPDDEELQRLKVEGEADEWWNSMYQSGVSYLPNMPSWMRTKKQQEPQVNSPEAQQVQRPQDETERRKVQEGRQPPQQPSKFQPPQPGVASPFYRNTDPATQKAGHDVKQRLKEREAEQIEAQENRPPHVNAEDSSKQYQRLGETASQQPPIRSRGKPRKLEIRSSNTPLKSTEAGKKKPRKIERRS